MAELFEKQNVFVPTSQGQAHRLPPFKHPKVHRETSDINEATAHCIDVKPLLPIQDSFQLRKADDTERAGDIVENRLTPNGDDNVSLIDRFASRDCKMRNKEATSNAFAEVEAKAPSGRDKMKITRPGIADNTGRQQDETGERYAGAESDSILPGHSKAVDDFNERMAEQEPASWNHKPAEEQSAIQEQQDDPTSSVIQNAYDRMRPKHSNPELAVVTIGSKVTTSRLGSSFSTKLKSNSKSSNPVSAKARESNDPRENFSSSMRSFAAPGSELINTVGNPQNIASKRIKDLSDDQEVPLSHSPYSSEEETSIQTNDHSTQDARVVEDMASQGSPSSNFQPDDEDLSEDEKKMIEEAKVAELIRQAEEASTAAPQDCRKRARQILKGAGQKDSTTDIIQIVKVAVEKIDELRSALTEAVQHSVEIYQPQIIKTATANDSPEPEERLSLMVSKTDFANMHISGQFNLGFVLVTKNNADLFIVDQHASDEKYNFERLQSTTVVQNQRLVQPRTLELTAIDEEIILEHRDALLKNGFLVHVDTSGSSPVGHRCKLVSLPMSREVIFDLTDLEELIALLADSSSFSSRANVPRPSKVRRMFAMRACRSSIMIGKTLTPNQMRAMVRKMGDIEKPWNCPHGRPTMRHICGLEGWETWSEGDGIIGLEEEQERPDWKSWVSDHRSDVEGI